MKSDIRRELARESFEEKIRKVGQLIQLSARVKSQPARENAEDAVDIAYLGRVREKEGH